MAQIAIPRTDRPSATLLVGFAGEYSLPEREGSWGDQNVSDLGLPRSRYVATLVPWLLHPAAARIGSSISRPLLVASIFIRYLARNRMIGFVVSVNSRSPFQSHQRITKRKLIQSVTNYLHTELLPCKLRFGFLS